MKKDEVRADDIKNMLSKCVDGISEISPLTDLEQDELWEAFQPILEKFFNYPDYRNYN